MRIIGGEYSGRVLKMPKGLKIRPTQDRVREAIFNVIRERVPGSVALDLFAGSGAFGIEALSRGAHFAVFVDNNRYCVKTIRSNLSALAGMDEFSQVLKKDAVKAIAGFGKEMRKFDIIFLDPPYYKGPLDKIGASRRAEKYAESLAKNSLIKIGACDILAQRGFVIAEHFKKDSVPEKTGALRLFKRKQYGDTVVSLYRKQLI